MFANIIDSFKDEMITSAQEILRIKSVKSAPLPGAPFGEGVNTCLLRTLEIAKSLGFRTCNVDGYVGYAEIGEGKEMVAILCHLDVVPEGDGWEYPPYGAEIHDDKIYARGTLDDKGPLVSSLYGIKAILDSGVKLSKRIRLIFGCDEESGSEDIEYYKKTNGETPVMGFTPDGSYPMITAEKGIINLHLQKEINQNINDGIKLISLNGGQRPNMVPSLCEAIISVPKEKLSTFKEAFETFRRNATFDITMTDLDENLKISSSGVSAHGSTPHLGKNAISQLISFLCTVDFSDKAIKEYLSFINEKVGFDINGASFKVGVEDKESGKLSLNFGIIELLGDKVTSTLDIRMPVTFKINDIINTINEQCTDAGITLTSSNIHQPLHIPATHPLVQTLSKVYEDFTGNKATLLSIGGGTYAKSFPNTLAFGPIFPGEPDLDHQANEYITIHNLILNSKIFAQAIYELAK